VGAGRDHLCQSQAFDKVSRLLHFLRLHASLSSQHPSVSPLGLGDSEIQVLLAAAEQLLGEESEIRRALIHGLLYGEGEFQGISRGFIQLSRVTRATFADVMSLIRLTLP
jgi:hypothetical protein